MMCPRQVRVFFALLFIALLAGCQQPLDEAEFQTQVARAVETLYAGLTPTAGLPTTTSQPTSTPLQVLAEMSPTLPPLTATASPSPSVTATKTLPATAVPVPETAIPTAELAEDLVSLGTPGNYRVLGSHARITDLQAWQGRIFIAHGDWTQNSGPVRALAYDPAAGSFLWDESFSFDEEQVEILRVGGDTLLVPGGDGREDWSFGNLYLHRPGNPWQKLRSLPGGVHVWDAVINGSTWIAVGSGDAGDGRIWISSDGGVTWNLDPAGAALLGVDAQNPLNTHAGLFRLNGLIYLSTASGCFMYQEESWQHAPGCDLSRSVQKYVEWDRWAVLVPYFSRPVDAADFLWFYDGITTQAVGFGQYVLDAVIYQGQLLVLTSPAAGKAQVFYSPNPAAGLTLLADLELPSGDILKPYADWPLALEALDGALYFGLNDGQLIRYELDD